jgi:hypothetical protein
MLDFEKMKAALESEKRRLETIIETQKKLLPYMEKMDKKIFNKKIVDYINEAGNLPIRAYTHNDGERKQLVIYHKDLPYNYNSLFWEIASKICDEKRFSYEKFKAQLIININAKLSELEAIKADLADGEKRAKELNYVQEYYRKLVKGFSYYARNKYDYDFKIGWIG